MTTKLVILAVGVAVLVAVLIMRIVGGPLPERIRKPVFYSGLVISAASFGASFLH